MAGTKPNPTDARTYYHRGNTLYEKGDYDKSIEEYNKAIILNGFSVQIRYPDTTIYLSKDELQNCILISQEFREYAIITIGIKE